MDLIYKIKLQKEEIVQVNEEFDEMQKKYNEVSSKLNKLEKAHPYLVQ